MGQQGRRRIGKGRLVLDAAAGGLDVFAAEAEEVLVRGLLEPDVEGHRPALEVIVDPPGRLELGLLDDVGGVHAGAHPGVEPELDDLAEEATVQGQEAVQGLPVSGADLAEQELGLDGVGPVEVHATTPCYGADGRLRGYALPHLIPRAAAAVTVSAVAFPPSRPSNVPFGHAAEKQSERPV